MEIIKSLTYIAYIFVYVCIMVITYSISMIDSTKPLNSGDNLIKVKNIQNTILALAILYTIPGIIVLFSYLIKAITQ